MTRNLGLVSKKIKALEKHFELDGDAFEGTALTEPSEM